MLPSHDAAAVTLSFDLTTDTPLPVSARGIADDDNHRRGGDVRHDSDHPPQPPVPSQDALRSTKRVALPRGGGDLVIRPHRRHSTIGQRSSRRQCAPRFRPSAQPPTPSRDEQVRAIEHLTRTRTSHRTSHQFIFVSVEEEIAGHCYADTAARRICLTMFLS